MAKPEKLPDGWRYDEPTNSVICGDCEFRFGAEHEDDEGGYSCPVCDLEERKWNAYNNAIERNLRS